jgi:hypothetical protein
MPRWLPRVLSRIHRLAAEGRVQFTDKALRELEALDLGLNEHDGAEVVLGLTARECAGRVFSPETAEWLYVFKPLVAGTALYVKLVLRAHCIVISFHRGESGDENED